MIIDVFRAFSVECYAFAQGARTILPVGDLETAYRLRRETPDGILVGERGGARCEGFDCGNSPSQLAGLDLSGRTVIHTTSAGTQGIGNAVLAEEMLATALVNASATAEYIRRRDPAVVSLVCMGLEGKRETQEDTLCAEYIRALLRGQHPDISEAIRDLRNTSGRKFFDFVRQDAFPKADFEMCTRLDCFDFALRVNRRKNGCHVERIPVGP